MIKTSINIADHGGEDSAHNRIFKNVTGQPVSHPEKGQIIAFLQEMPAGLTAVGLIILENVHSVKYYFANCSKAACNWGSSPYVIV